MKIQFTQSRQLLSGKTVAAGEELELEETEAKAFILNGFAVAVKSKLKEKKE